MTQTRQALALLICLLGLVAAGRADGRRHRPASHLGTIRLRQSTLS